MNDYQIKDSGKRQEFNTGAVRDIQEDKGAFYLLPPHAIAEVAVHYQKGAKKYAERNWEKGIPLQRYMDSLLRHAFQVLYGDKDENHAAALAWNALCFLETRWRIENGYLPPELDDLPKYKKIGDTNEVKKD